MADQSEAYQALMDAIHTRTKRLLDDPMTLNSPQGGELLRLAEAYAWLVVPGQAHGGSMPSR